MIEIQGLEFNYPRGDFRLRVEHLNVAVGEKVAVTGPSGSGKTTLLNLVAGIVTPARGTVAVAGEMVSALGDAARRAFRITRVGFVFQDFELVEYLSVLDNILHPYRISGALELDGAVRARARTLADRLGIGDKLARGVTDLSQGERQRVAICRAMLPHPKLLLADEATGNLDPENKFRILDLLFEEAAEVGATVLAVTHDHALLPRFDRVVNFADFRSTVAA
jgi:putative ABC transport system ATP-binding protein